MSNIIKGREYNEISDILNNETDKKTAKEIVEIFMKNNLLVTTHAYEYILKNKIYEKGLINEIIKIARDNGTDIVTEEFIIEFCIKKEEKADKEEKKEKFEEEKKEDEKREVEIKAKEEAIKEQKEYAKEQKEAVEKQIKPISAFKPNFKISDYSIVSDGGISDFAAYFQDRYKTLSSIIKRRIEYRDAREISKINEGEDACVIGMISDKFETKYGLRLEIEDLTGRMRIMIDKNKISPDTEKLITGLVSDEVIGVKGRVGKNKTMYVSDIVEPDVPYDFVPNKAEKDVYAVFTSDLHIGSILFLQKEFENFIEWVNLKRNRLDIAEKVKYILIAGDIVDGVGVYPHQERELALTDIYKQYDFAAELISRIREDIEIIISPGNHDAVRIAEPQPELSKKFAPKFYEMKNVHLVKNPAYVNIEGVNVLMYHGEALDNLIRAIPGLSYTEPQKAMREFLKKRHLSPIYKDIFPSEKDNLCIKDIPDVIHCGHVHSLGYENYKGVHLINSGCFQGRTKYQEELGHIPTPSKVPIMNLRTHNITIMDFEEK